MKKLLFILLVATSLPSMAQDTTWVQTFTFDSISTRRADFTFPQELNDMRFEKVLMYYKLKCSPLTPWDQYDCGEWDYLAYTRIFDHTGTYDSVQVDGAHFLNNTMYTPIYDYEPWGYNYSDDYEITEHDRSGSATVINSLGMTPTGVANYPFDLNSKGGRHQMLITATELTAAGIGAGDLQSLALYVNSVTNGGELMHPRISLKSTTDVDITAFHDTGFTEVYDLTRSGGAAPVLVVGENEFLFYQPYTWNGTDNIIVDFSFDISVMNINMIDFDTETSAAGMAVNYPDKNGVLSFTGSEYAMFELSDVDLGDAVTITFWAKGMGNTGVNTSILEASDTVNNRVMNIHMPWSNNRIYWDCGVGSGYDRIDQDMTGAGIDNEWHHWAFTKNQATGEMKIIRDGVLWHSGTGLTRTIGEMHRLYIGANRSLGNNWNGKIDEFQIFNTELSEATVAAWYMNKTNASHPNWADLMVYYDFDNEEWAQDQSNGGTLLMPSTQGLFDFSEYPLVGVQQDVDRPVVSFGTGTVAGATADVTVVRTELEEPEVVFEMAEVFNHFEIVNAFVAAPAGDESYFDITGTETITNPYATSEQIANDSITYFEAPYEIIHDVEIGRFITPYGIQFDLGINGFSWIYDVTDYQQYLHDIVDLAAHNTQELIDLKFAFIEGIPPRDVHMREPIWSDHRSYNYGNMANDVDLQSIAVTLSDTSEMFKVKTRFTGHGHNGNYNCCEWVPKDHKILVDGVERFNWDIWEETACGDNPNISQGGTWPYAREGWCPGDMVKEYDHELTPWVTPGTVTNLDYDITPVPATDPNQAGGNYRVAMDLISYSAPNHQYDAAVLDILNPNSYEYYGKWNPGCQNPRVMIQNTGEQTMTSCTIRAYISTYEFDYEWTGSLEFLEKEIVEIPVPSLGWWNNENVDLTMTAEIVAINGDPGLDEYENNDKKVVAFEAPEMIDNHFLVWFNTNNKAFENTWRLEDESGNVIFDSQVEHGTLAGSTTYKDTFNLDDGCYSIILEDSDNDGIGFWYSSQVEGETTGTFRVRIVGGGYVEFFPADFGNFHRYNFTVGYQVGLNEKYLDHDITVFPNPNDGIFTVELSGHVDNDAEMEIYDLMGRSVYKERMNANSVFANSIVDLSHVPSGQYLVKIKTGSRVYTKKFVKN